MQPTSAATAASAAPTDASAGQAFSHGRRARFGVFRDQTRGWKEPKSWRRDIVRPDSMGAWERPCALPSEQGEARRLWHVSAARSEGLTRR